MDGFVKIKATILPSKKEVKRTYHKDFPMNEGEWFNCIDPENLEQKFKLVKIIGKNYYFYPVEYESKVLDIF